MSPDLVTTLLHEALAWALFYSVFCRAVRLNCSAGRDVRLAFWLLGIAAIAAVAAPIQPGWRPDGLTLILLAAFALVQIVTARYWCNGVPSRFLKPKEEACKPSRHCS